MPLRKLAAAAACVLTAAIVPMTAASADPSGNTYGDAVSVSATDLMYLDAINGNQDWAMTFTAQQTGLPNTATVVASTFAPLDVRVYSGNFLGGSGTLVASKTGAPISMTADGTVAGTDYVYSLTPASAQTILVKNTTYTIVVTVKFSTHLGVLFNPNYTKASQVEIAAAGTTSWTAYSSYRLASKVNVQTDLVDPTGSAAFTVDPTGTNGWYTSYPTAHFTCSDVGLGVASCPADQTASLDGNFTPQGTVTDLVGNSYLITGPTAKIDTTAPSLSEAFDGTLGLNGWYTSLGTLAAECEDETSGIAQCVSPTATQDGTLTLTSKAVDNAGNTTSHDVQVKVDTTAPTLSAAFNGTLGSHGWYTTLGTLQSDCTDATSGVAACPSVDVTSDGVKHLSVTATDKAGNQTTKTYDVKVDSTAPGLSTVFEGTEGTNGWYTSLGTLQSDCTDEGSGIDTCVSPTATTEGTSTLTASATDMAGNVTSKDVQVKVDTVAPTASVTGVANGAMLTAGSTGALQCTAADATSGVASCTLHSTPALSVIGRHSVVADAVDNAGNHTTSAPLVVFTAPRISWGPANNATLRAGSWVTFTYTLTTSSGQLVDSKVSYLKPLPGKSAHALNFSKYAKRISTGKYQMRVFLPASMSSSKYWKFGVSVAGKTMTRTYIVK